MKAKELSPVASRQRWINLALAAILGFYTIQVALDVIWNNTCGHLGTDYCAFWSAGRVATELGYAKVYDLRLLGQAQLTNFPAFGDRSTFAVSPVAYLPIFLPPFQLLSLLPPVPGFWIWTLVNTLAFALYLRFFNLKTLKIPLASRLLLMLFVSLPVYWNFLDGQVNVWLMICIGEFIRHIISDQPLKAGLWLGGLLLKPQTLFVLAAVILFRGSRKVLAGLLITSIAIIGASVALVGRNGISSMLQVWLGFAKGIPTNDVDSMMNWRMLGFHLSNWFSADLGSAAAAVGMVLTAAATIYLWRRPLVADSPGFMIALLGSLAATGLVDWHSHIHMAMILIPPLILLYQRETLVKDGLLACWVLVPAAAYFLVYILAALIRVNLIPSSLTVSINFLRGLSQFSMLVWILAEAVQSSRRPLGPGAPPLVAQGA
jgi:hypothetical protein